MVFMGYVEKYGTAGHSTDDSIRLPRKIRFACRITKARKQAHTDKSYN
jgi:hypothetical protein